MSVVSWSVYIHQFGYAIFVRLTCFHSGLLHRIFDISLSVCFPLLSSECLFPIFCFLLKVHCTADIVVTGQFNTELFKPACQSTIQSTNHHSISVLLIGQPPPKCGKHVCHQSCSSIEGGVCRARGGVVCVCVCVCVCVWERERERERERAPLSHSKGSINCLLFLFHPGQ